MSALPTLLLLCLEKFRCAGNKRNKKIEHVLGRGINTFSTNKIDSDLPSCLKISSSIVLSCHLGIKLVSLSNTSTSFS